MKILSNMNVAGYSISEKLSGSMTDATSVSYFSNEIQVLSIIRYLKGKRDHKCRFYVIFILQFFTFSVLLYNHNYNLFFLCKSCQICQRTWKANYSKNIQLIIKIPTTTRILYLTANKYFQTHF